MGAREMTAQKGITMNIQDVKNVTVAGGGTQGSQIASQIAYKGFQVTVWVRSEASTERAKPRFASIYGQYIDTLEAMKTDPKAYCRGLADKSDLTPEEVDQLLEQAKERLHDIQFETDFDKAFGNADVVVECINENKAEKEAFYSELAKHLPERTLLLTDSSTMLPSMFMDATGRPEKFLTLHFANQIWRNNLTELMKTDKTSQESFELADQFARAIGMLPMRLNKEQPGYILNTLLIPWLKAAMGLYANGVSDPETIDMTWQLATGADPTQTPFRKMDKIGLALCRNIMGMDPSAKDPNSTLGKSVALLDKYIAEGKTGIAVGEGFYKYTSYDK